MRLLAVPIRMDALCLSADTAAAGPVADYSRLPYVDRTTGRDVGGQVPFLSDVVTAEPFDESARLAAGVHLHWALPDALTRLVHDDRGVAVPRVPNRWLVTRSLPETGVDGRWLVESDALSDDARSGVAYPLSPGDPPSPSGRPFRYLGRVTPLSEWSAPAAEQLPELTVFGYGEPTFAAFYPNSHSVFGFHDRDHTDGAPTGVRYDVVGWYAERDADELVRVLGRRRREWTTIVATALGWNAPDSAGPPGGLVCYGRLVVHSGALVGLPAPPAETGVYVADAPTEALAAHLASRITGLSPDGLENLLEGIAVAEPLERSVLDLPIRLADARHTASFRALAGGTTWTVRRRDERAALLPPSGGAPSGGEPRLPAEVGERLVALNALQGDLDRDRSVLADLRRRLFADWHRYLTCAYPPDHDRDGYPDPDLVAVQLRRQLDAVTELEARIGADPDQPEDTQVRRLHQARKQLEEALTGGAGGAGGAAAYVLQAVPAEPWYVPNEPVVLLTGEAATPSDRYGHDAAGPDGLLPCAVIDARHGRPATRNAMVELAEAVSQLLGTLPAGHPAVRHWTGPPWHPVLLHWEVEFYPARSGNNLSTARRDYAPDFLTRTYALPVDDVELRPTGRPVPDRGANVYTGSTVLSAAAEPVLSTRILQYLKGGPLARYNSAEPVRLSPEEVDADPARLLAWCAAGDDPSLVALAAAYRHLVADESGTRRHGMGSTLSQSLGGFNDALVMLRLVHQLPIADPLGFADDQDGEDLATAVAAAVGGENRHGLLPLTGFNPIRAGAMRLRRLRIVDNFGLGHDVDVSTPQTSARLRVTAHPDWVAMPPRLAQPARLRLRLLDAGHDRRPCTGLPDSSPVCGWFLPDLLGGLHVHDADGAWLGTLLPLPEVSRPSAARWVPPPGGDGGLSGPGLIGNAHLRTVVTALHEQGPDAVAQLLQRLERALEGVEPEQPSQHTSRVLLTGRPVAVVRLSVDLEVAGLAPLHQDWNVFRSDLTRSERETNGYPLVRFGVRVGAHGRLGDGVLGYWIESPDGRPGDYQDVPSLTEAGAPLEVEVGVGLPEQVLVVLLEPAGAIHAGTGILPTASVRLDDVHHHDVLARMGTGFLVAPVLTDSGDTRLPLPTAAGRAWSWLERSGTGWASTAAPGRPGAAFPVGLTAREGWLVSGPDSPQ